MTENESPARFVLRPSCRWWIGAARSRPSASRA